VHVFFHDFLTIRRSYILYFSSGWRTQRCASSDSAVVLDYRSHTWGDDEELLDEEEAEGAARAWRTPSVVVSDFSDETPPVWLDLNCLDEQESERCRRLSDCSSCSGGLCAPQRKVSDCSTCSTLSGDEDSSTAELRPLRQQPTAKVRKISNHFLIKAVLVLQLKIF
jgi:hypothetical protein